MIKLNSKDLERTDDNRSNDKLDRGFVSDKVMEDKRINELTNRVNSMIKSQDTQINS
jgi:hypothetical protein